MSYTGELVGAKSGVGPELGACGQVEGGLPSFDSLTASTCPVPLIPARSPLPPPPPPVTSGD